MENRTVYEMSDFNNFTTPKARHEHRCEYCGQSIPKGEKHSKFSGVFEGEFQNWRMHSECYDAWQDSGDEYFEPFRHDRPINVKYKLLHNSLPKLVKG
jgi:hypothetical protein